MIWPLGETLCLIQPYVPAQLIAPQAVLRAQKLAESLPNAFAAHYFECRLAPGSTQVDFSTCVLARNGGRECLAWHDPSAFTDDTLPDQAKWTGVWRLLQAWAHPASPLYAQLPLIWLEFDSLNAPGPTVPLPGVNLCLDPGYIAQPLRPKLAQPSSPAGAQALLATACTYLLGQPLAPAVPETLQRCFAHLPAGGQILYLSAMLSRQPATLKLNGIIPKAQLLAYLAAIGWTGSATAIHQIITTFCTMTEKIRFDLTVGPVLSTRVGIEIFSKGLAQSTAARQQLLDRLVANELCCAEKRVALLAWSGYSQVRYSQPAGPASLRRSWYVKVVYSEEQPLEAKGYLGFTPGPPAPFAFVRTASKLDKAL